MNSIFDVAGTLADGSAWKLTNLSLQKMAYVAQMIHLGESGQPFFNDDFEAWDYGPVSPPLYHELKMFGGDAVRPYARLGRVLGPNDLQKEVLAFVLELGEKRKPGQLVALTHWPEGAWSKNYRKGVKRIRIPKSDILSEYKARTKVPA